MKTLSKLIESEEMKEYVCCAAQVHQRTERLSKGERLHPFEVVHDKEKP